MKIRSINQDVSAYQDQRITWLKCNIAKIRFTTNSSLAIKVSKQSGGMCQWAEKIHKRKERSVFQIRRTPRKTHKSRHFFISMMPNQCVTHTQLTWEIHQT